VATTPVINRPEVAIIGPNRIVERPMFVPDGLGGERIAKRKLMNISISCDHRGRGLGCGQLRSGGEEADRNAGAAAGGLRRRPAFSFSAHHAAIGELPRAGGARRAGTRQRTCVTSSGVAWRIEPSASRTRRSERAPGAAAIDRHFFQPVGAALKRDGARERVGHGEIAPAIGFPVDHEDHAIARIEAIGAFQHAAHPPAGAGNEAFHKDVAGKTHRLRNLRGQRRGDRHSPDHRSPVLKIITIPRRTPCARPGIMLAGSA
jgi:hypothetical protein